jgi:NAD(P)-dependent dehydrogenase (short-subunit alcohol dehydrogenase family)
MSSAQLALITGANKGIGYQVALTLATQNKYHILLGARNKDEGEKATKAIEELGGSVEFIQLDVTDDATIFAARDFITKKYGKLDVLINNAGVASRESSVSAQLYDTYKVNVFGPAVLIEAFTDLLEKSDNARIVNVSSTMGSITTFSDPAFEFYNHTYASYNSSKSALNSLTACYAVLLEKKGIKVNCVDPGFTATDLNGHRGYRTTNEAAESVNRAVLIEKDGPTGKYFAIDGSTLPW